MLNRAPAKRSPRGGEAGFTLIELLVVILVVGILAAIALPMLLSQSGRAMDADAKSDARNLEGLVEQCGIEAGDYRLCDSSVELDGATSLPWGNAPGQVRVSASAVTTYTVTAISKSTTGGSNHTFRVRKRPNGTVVRRCTTPSGNTLGGCNAGTW